MTMSSIKLDKITNKLADYFVSCRFPVICAYLFGSYAKDSARTDSDVDVAVLLDELDQKKRIGMLSPLIYEIGEALKVDAVDVCLLTDDRNGFVYNALRNSILVFCRDDTERAKLETTVLQEYFGMEDVKNIVEHYFWKRVEKRRMGEGGIDMLDKRAVASRMQYIEETLGALKECRNLSYAEFAGDRKTHRSALYDMQTCLEAMTDIATHLTGALGLKLPENRAGIFHLLAEQLIISEVLAKRLGQAVAMRNIIIHGYLEVALEPVYHAIQNDLGDIEDFCGAIKRYLEEKIPRNSFL